MTATQERAGLLAESLEEINAALVELTAVFRVKRQVLARADLEGLQDVLSREEAVLERIFDAETKREVLTEEIAALLGSPRDRLADIATSLDEGSAEVVTGAGLRLRDTISVLVREANIVAEVCRAAMEHYDKLIRIISGAGIPAATYSPAGRPDDGARRSIIDQAF